MGYTKRQDDKDTPPKKGLFRSLMGSLFGRKKENVTASSADKTSGKEVSGEKSVPESHPEAVSPDTVSPETVTPAPDNVPHKSPADSQESFSDTVQPVKSSEDLRTEVSGSAGGNGENGQENNKDRENSRNKDKEKEKSDENAFKNNHKEDSRHTEKDNDGENGSIKEKIKEEELNKGKNENKDKTGDKGADVILNNDKSAGKSVAASGNKAGSALSPEGIPEKNSPLPVSADDNLHKEKGSGKENGGTKEKDGGSDSKFRSPDKNSSKSGADSSRSVENPSGKNDTSSQGQDNKSSTAGAEKVSSTAKEDAAKKESPQNNISGDAGRKVMPAGGAPSSDKKPQDTVENNSSGILAAEEHPAAAKVTADFNQELTSVIMKKLGGGSSSKPQSSSDSTGSDSGSVKDKKTENPQPVTGDTRQKGTTMSAIEKALAAGMAAVATVTPVKSEASPAAPAGKKAPLNPESTETASDTASPSAGEGTTAHSTGAQEQERQVTGKASPLPQKSSEETPAPEKTAEKIQEHQKAAAEIANKKEQLSLKKAGTEAEKAAVNLDTAVAELSLSTKKNDDTGGIPDDSKNTDREKTEAKDKAENKAADVSGIKPFATSPEKTASVSSESHPAVSVSEKSPGKQKENEAPHFSVKTTVSGVSESTAKENPETGVTLSGDIGSNAQVKAAPQALNKTGDGKKTDDIATATATVAGSEASGSSEYSDIKVKEENSLHLPVDDNNSSRSKERNADAAVIPGVFPVLDLSAGGHENLINLREKQIAGIDDPRIINNIDMAFGVLDRLNSGLADGFNGSLISSSRYRSDILLADYLQNKSLRDFMERDKYLKDLDDLGFRYITIKSYTGELREKLKICLRLKDEYARLADDPGFKAGEEKDLRRYEDLSDRILQENNVADGIKRALISRVATIIRNLELEEEKRMASFIRDALTTQFNEMAESIEFCAGHDIPYSVYTRSFGGDGRDDEVKDMVNHYLNQYINRKYHPEKHLSAFVNVRPGTADSQFLKYVNIVRKNIPLIKLLDALGRTMGLDAVIRARSEKIYKARMNRHRKKRGDHISGITLGDSLSYVLPEELLRLGDPDFEILFNLKILNRELLSFDFNRVAGVFENAGTGTGDKSEKQGGPVIVCVDTSGSMKGEAEDYAKAVALVVAFKCMEAGRQCYIINFAVEMEAIYVDPENRDTSLDHLNSFLKRSLRGGTSIDSAMLEVSRVVRTDERFARADLLCVTDGKYLYSEETLREIKNNKENCGTRYFEFVKGYADSSQHVIFDKVFMICNGRFTEI